MAYIRPILISLCSLLLLLAGCASAPPTTLPAGYGIVILRALAEPDGTVKQLLFEGVEGQESFIINVDRRAKLKIVRPGFYYLANLRSSAYDGELPGFDVPEDRSLAIEVREGAVNYIGDYQMLETFDEDSQRIMFDYQYRLNDRTKERALELFPWIAEYPLRATNPQGRSRPMRCGAEGAGSFLGQEMDPAEAEDERID